jgi:hypothetical protein
MEYDEIIIKLKKNENSNRILEEIAGDFRLLELWRKEIESDKQSIFIIGKTSTGKSEFHNLLLDTDNKDEFIFKTSTRVETGVIQSLQHCENKENARAEISVRNIEEFDKLPYKHIPGILTGNNVIILPLKTVKDICFLRDQVMAKSDDANSYNVIVAVNVINIHFPLKYFKNFILIDTPGLGSHESLTDNVVRNYFYGKSHILWLLNTSKRTLSDCISLMRDEKNLLINSLDKIVFIGNKFDLIEVEDNERHVNLKEELTTTLNNELGKIIFDKKKHVEIFFTSFKKPNKRFGDSTSYDELKKLEEKILLERKITSFNNIDRFVAALVDVLKIIKEKFITSKKEIISKKIQENEFESKILQKNKDVYIALIPDIKDLSSRLKNEIIAIKKEDNLSNHERYNNYLKLFKKSIIQSTDRFNHLIRAKLNKIVNNELQNKIEKLIFLKDFTLKNKESLGRRFVYDGELYEQRELLNSYVNEKIALIIDIETLLINLIGLHVESISKRIHFLRENIQNQKSNKIHINYDLEIINAILYKIININTLLREDIEINIEKWNPIYITNNVTESDVLFNFLELNSLLDEHNTISNRIKNR